jgi:hypothetical protein
MQYSGELAVVVVLGQWPRSINPDGYCLLGLKLCYYLAAKFLGILLAVFCALLATQ